MNTPPPGQPVNNWGGPQSTASSFGQPQQAGHQQAQVKGSLPWELIIWGIGTTIYFIGILVIFASNQDPANGMEQQLMEIVRISDLLIWTAVAGSLTTLAWLARRVILSIRGR